MEKSAYDIGYDDGYNGKDCKDKDELANLMLGMVLPGLPDVLDDFDYEKYTDGYDKGEEERARD